MAYLHVSRVRTRSAVVTSHKDTPYSTSDSGYYGGGYEYYYNAQPGDWINRMDVRTGTRVDAITFYTGRHGSSTKFGGNGGDPYTITHLSEDYRWTGNY